MAKRAPIRRRKKTRKRNPRTETQRQINAASNLYRVFREAEPKHVNRVRLSPNPRVLMEIGKLDGVLYTTTHQGKKVSYIHKFTNRARPTLAASFDGKRLFVLGGAYNFTADGIVDRK